MVIVGCKERWMVVLGVNEGLSLVMMVVGAGLGTAVMLLPVTAFASTESTYSVGTGPDFDSVTSPIVDLIDSLLTPAIAIVGALGTVYCVILGAKFAKAEEPQEREGEVSSEERDHRFRADLRIDRSIKGRYQASDQLGERYQVRQSRKTDR